MSVDLDALFGKMKDLRVAVVGDVMLDIYWWGQVDRISPEAPVPVVSLKKKETRLGGAANVALNLRALGAQVDIYSVTGNDEDAQCLRELLKERQIKDTGVMQSDGRITTTKSRIISRHQQMLRLDAEMTDDLTEAESDAFLEGLVPALEAAPPDILILEDYNKGVLTAKVITAVLKACSRLHIPTCVDPKLKNFLHYKGVTIFKPNLKEVKEGLGILMVNTGRESLRKVHAQLEKALGHQVTLITLSEHGIFYEQGQEAAVLPPHLRNIADVSGAGDTVMATAAVVWALTKDVPLMAAISNIAGGLVCEEVGVVAIDRQKLLAECKRLLR